MDTMQQLIDKISNPTLNNYTFSINGINHTQHLSVLSVNGHETLNKPWRYEIIFTSNDKQLAADAMLTKKASFTFEPPAPILSRTISSLTEPALPRTLHGVITEFSQLSVNKQEARYKVILEPRLALLGLYHYSAIY